MIKANFKNVLVLFTDAFIKTTENFIQYIEGIHVTDQIKIKIVFKCSNPVQEQ